jgi:hypothetical protein
MSCFFKQVIIQQRQQLIDNLRVTAKTLLFSNSIPRLITASPIQVFNGDPLLLDILEHAGILKFQDANPRISVSPSIKFS